MGYLQYTYIYLDYFKVYVHCTIYIHLYGFIERFMYKIQIYFKVNVQYTYIYLDFLDKVERIKNKEAKVPLPPSFGYQIDDDDDEDEEGPPGMVPLKLPALKFDKPFTKVCTCSPDRRTFLWGEVVGMLTIFYWFL